MEKLERHRGAIVRVGGGRGFIVQGGKRRLVITAAHCLTTPLDVRVNDWLDPPVLPPCTLASYGEEKTYRDLLGPVGEAAPTVWCECLFVDPVNDVAIVGEPDGQDWYEQSEAYEALTEEVTPIKIREGKMGESVWVLGLDGQFRSGGTVQHLNERYLGMNGTLLDRITDAGMSGSPVLGEDGSAISICAVSGEMVSQINLVGALPGWFRRYRRFSYAWSGPPN